MGKFSIAAVSFSYIFAGQKFIEKRAGYFSVVQFFGDFRFPISGSIPFKNFMYNCSGLGINHKMTFFLRILFISISG